VQSVVEPCVGETDAAKVVTMTEQWCNLWSGLRIGSDDERGSSGAGGGAAAASRGGAATKKGRRGGANESDELSEWMGKLRSLPLGALFESEDKSISTSEASSSFADDSCLGAGEEDRWGEVYPMTHYYDLARAACAIDFGLPHAHSDTHDPGDRSSQQVRVLVASRPLLLARSPRRSRDVSLVLCTGYRDALRRRILASLHAARPLASASCSRNAAAAPPFVRTVLRRTQVLALLVKLLEFQSTLFAPEHRSWASGWTERKGGEHKAMCVLLFFLFALFSFLLCSLFFVYSSRCVRRLDEILNDDAVASHDATKLRLLSLFFLRFPTEALEHQNEMLYTLADVRRRSAALRRVLAVRASACVRAFRRAT
jgi:hypothetical protein